MFWHFPPIFVLLNVACLPSGNTFWPQSSVFPVFQKTHQIDDFWHFWLTFVHSKCKRSSLCSQYWMRLFLWFSTTVALINLRKGALFLGSLTFLTIFNEWACWLWIPQSLHTQCIYCCLLLCLIKFIDRVEILRPLFWSSMVLGQVRHQLVWTLHHASS